MASSYQVSNINLRIQQGTERTIYATWTFDQTKAGHFDHYEVEWQYATTKSDKSTWFAGTTNNSVTLKNDVYNPPSNAKKVRCYVKPVSKTYTKTVNKKSTTVSYWQSKRKKSSEFTYPTAEPDPTPAVPSVPTASIDGYTLTADINNISDSNTTHIEFRVVKNDLSVISKIKTEVVKNHAGIEIQVTGGLELKVRARAIHVMGMSSEYIGYQNQLHRLATQRHLYEALRNGVAVGETELLHAGINPTPGGSVNLNTVFNSLNQQIALINQKIASMDTIYEEKYSAFSEYTANIQSPPNTPKGIKKVSVISTTEVQIDWYNVASATSYVIEYTRHKRYFDSSPENVQSLTVSVGHAELTGLDSGVTWYFRVKAINSGGESGWTEISSVLLGAPPGKPTTWSEISSAVSGSTVNLYWQHNSVDTSAQTAAQVEVTNNGQTYTYNVNSAASYYALNTGSYTANSSLTWRVRTKGAHPDWSSWSTTRTIKIYERPVVELDIDGPNCESVGGTEFLATAFPITVSALATPCNEIQYPTAYSINVTSNSTYTTVDSIGRRTVVHKDETVYSCVKYVSKANSDSACEFTLNASNIDLESGQDYTVKCTASTNTGLTANSAVTLDIDWDELDLSPNARTSYIRDDYSMNIIPYCVDDNNDLIPGVTLGVYRREFDGSFTEIASGISNNYRTVVDPHPSLDYARYRIVATETATGGVGYYDFPGIPIFETSIIIQWEEESSMYDYDDDYDDDLLDPIHSSSILTLPYNISINDTWGKDIELVEYIGRTSPVSYYGTQLGISSTWTAEIPATDSETLYQVRRLASYMGDVYVREPSGVGYWAQVNVSYTKSYDKLVIPITIEVTKVDGGT